MNLVSDKRNNTGGIHKFYFVHLTQVSHESGGEVLLKPGGSWSQGFATKFSLSFRERARFRRQGKAISSSFEGFIPKLTEELNAVLLEMYGEPHIVVYRDYNGNLRKIGSRLHPVFFDYSHSPGRRPGNDSGVDFSFSGNHLPEDNFFTGDLFVSEVENVNPPASNEPVVFKVNGVTIASAEPGQTVLFTTDYDFDHQIIGS